MSERRDRVLVVEDDPIFGRQLVSLLSRSFTAEWAPSLAAARGLLERMAFHGVLLDVRLGGPRGEDRDGLELLAELRAERPLLPVIVMTAYGDVEIAVVAMKLGATDFLEKGEIEPAGLVRRLREAMDEVNKQLSLEARAAEQVQLEPSSLVGGSPAMAPVREAVELAAADGHCSVLILGETGTGKGMVARAIHQQGWRRKAPFVAVPTAGLSSSLLDSELFGHEKGAFTGAERTHTGYVEGAQGGVLFLDEIGDLGIDLQVKLLRFLEDHVVFRVGSSKGRPVEAQVVAATHRPLKSFVQEGRFREDLYYRLRTVEITVPPLRERAEDVLLLADHFLQLLRRQGRTKLTGFSSSATGLLQAYAWPGNARELKAAIEWAVLAGMHRGHSVIELEDLPAALRTVPPGPPGPAGAQPDCGGDDEEVDVERTLARAELGCVERALRQCSGKKLEAQKLLGYPNRQTMRRRVHNLCERYPDLMGRFPETERAYRGTEDLD